MEKDSMLRVGVITTTHGIRGEVKVFPTTDDPNRFRVLKNAYLDLGKELMPVQLEGVKYFKQMVILKFKEINSCDEANLYRNKDILVDRDEAVPLAEGEYYICDLIGLPVVSEEGESIGVLTDVMETGANDVYEVKRSDNTTVLIPAIKDCIREINPKEKRIVIHVMPGLLD